MMSQSESDEEEQLVELTALILLGRIRARCNSWSGWEVVLPNGSTLQTLTRRGAIALAHTRWP